MEEATEEKAESVEELSPDDPVKDEQETAETSIPGQFNSHEALHTCANLLSMHAMSKILSLADLVSKK